MYIVIALVQDKPEHKTELVDGYLNNAPVFFTDEPGCLRLDVIQDAGDPNPIWLYEVFKDESAYKEHLEFPQVITWLETSKAWRVEGPGGTLMGSTNIWPLMASGNELAVSQLERVEGHLAFNEERAVYSPMSLNLYERAIPHFDKAIKAAPNDAIACSLLETVF